MFLERQDMQKKERDMLMAD
jgi:hypothetical protein